MPDLIDAFSSGRLVAIFAHPDDETLAAGGLIARWAATGRPPHVVCISDGAQERDAAFTEAVGLLGATGQMLNHPTNSMRVDGKLVRDIDKVLYEIEPSVIVTHWPGLFQNQDHAAVHGAVMRSAARSVWPTVLLSAEPHLPDPRFTPNVFVRIGDFLSDKIRAASVYDRVLSREYLSPSFIAGRASWWGTHLEDRSGRAEAFNLEFWR